MNTKVVLITGALTGIGRATALAFAKVGAWWRAWEAYLFQRQISFPGMAFALVGVSSSFISNRKYYITRDRPLCRWNYPSN
jgi:hypothetical protein